MIASLVLYRPYFCLILSTSSTYFFWASAGVIPVSASFFQADNLALPCSEGRTQVNSLSRNKQFD